MHDSLARGILVVSADPTVARLTTACLRAGGHLTVLARGRAEAIASAARTRPDLVVIDPGSLYGDGTALARDLRMRYVADAPILFLVEADEVARANLALTVGCDRYLVKPFSLDDLTAQVRALLRRAAGPGPHPDAVLRFADLELDEDTLDVRRKGRTLGLAPRERRILRYLLVTPAGRSAAPRLWNTSGPTTTAGTGAPLMCTCAICAAK